MASADGRHADNVDRVLIRPDTCSTSVVKKSSVGHVPHEPSKGAVVAVPAISASTAAHGGQRIASRTAESKQKHSMDMERDAVSPAVRNDIAQPPSLRSQQQILNGNHIIQGSQQS